MAKTEQCEGQKDMVVKGQVVQMYWSPFAIAAIVGYPVPPNFTLVDLSSLFNRNILNVGLDRFSGHNSHVRKTFATEARWINLVRLTDRALQQHEAARELLDDFLQLASTGRISPFYRAVDALEDCVLSTHRALRMATALRGDGYLHSASPPPTQRQADAIRDMRDAIMHTDDRVLATSRTPRRPPIQPGQPYMLRPLQHRIELGPHRLSYRDLASCVRLCYRMVEGIRGPSQK